MVVEEGFTFEEQEKLNWVVQHADWPSVEHLCRAMLSADAQKLEARRYLSKALCQQGFYEEALEQACFYHEKNPESHIAVRAVAKVLVKWGQWQKKQRYIGRRKIRRFGSWDGGGLSASSRWTEKETDQEIDLLQQRAGDNFDLARNLLETDLIGRSLTSEDVKGLSLLATSYRHLELYASEFRTLFLAQDLDPKNGYILAHIAWAYHKKGLRVLQQGAEGRSDRRTWNIYKDFYAVGTEILKTARDIDPQNIFVSRSINQMRASFLLQRRKRYTPKELRRCG